MGDSIFDELNGGQSTLTSAKVVLQAADNLISNNSEGSFGIIAFIGGRTNLGVPHVAPIYLPSNMVGPTEALSEALDHIRRYLLQGAANDLDKDLSNASRDDEDIDEDEDAESVELEDMIKNLELEANVDDLDEAEDDLVQAGLFEFRKLVPVDDSESSQRFVPHEEDDVALPEDVFELEYEEDEELFVDPSDRIDPKADYSGEDDEWTKVAYRSTFSPPQTEETSTVSEMEPEILGDGPIFRWGSLDDAFADHPMFKEHVDTEHPQQTNETPTPPSTSSTPILWRPPFLRRYQMAYNTVNDILVCQNPNHGGSCFCGIPVLEAYTHLTSPNVNVNSPRRPHGYKIRESKGDFTNTLRELLPLAPFTSEDMRKVRPNPGQLGPIVGILPPAPGYICNTCGHGSRSFATARKHWLENHKPKGRTTRSVPRSDRFRDALVQSIGRWQPSSVCYFEIKPDPNDTTASAGTPASLTDLDILSKLQSDLFGADFDTQAEEIDPQAVMEFFRNSGAHAHVEGFDSTHLLSLVDLPRSNEHLLIKLRRAQLLRFMSGCNKILNGNLAVRRLLVTTIPGTMVHKKYNPPAKRSSRVRYALEELRLLSFVIRCYSDGLYLAPSGAASPSPAPLEVSETSSFTHVSKQKNGKYAIVLTDAQVNAVRTLLEHLGAYAYNARDLHTAIDTLAEALYMPDNAQNMMADAFESPVMAMVCLRTIKSDGGFKNPKHITVNLVALQSPIRQCLYFTAIRRQHNTDQQDDPSYDWFQPISELFGKWAVQTRVSPLGSLREWIARLSHFVFNTPPPDMVEWHDEDNMSLKAYKIHIPTYFKCVLDSLEDTRKHVRTKVLRDFKISLTVPHIDSQNYTTHGHSIFGPPADSLRNSDSAAFLGALLREGTLCRLGPDGTIIWDLPMVLRWLTDIDRAWSEVYCLLHILSLPGRGTEETIFQWTNSKDGRRHLCVINQVIGLLSDYHKGHQTTGLYKQILRLMPNELGFIITILIRTVRPVEVAAYAQLYSSEDQKENLRFLYTSKLFVSFGQQWKSDRLSTLLKAWWKRYMDLPFGLNLHRQFAVGLQRKFLSYVEENPFHAAAPTALAHSRVADELNYAKSKSQLHIPLSKQQLFETTSRHWLSLHGFKHPETYRADLWDDTPVSSNKDRTAGEMLVD